ncbi:Protein SGT1 ecdysoneless [Thelohanellus kitauei]|uniref:Protein SGT1 ecdysoneless n=1 Tax=Thelohanellus kitauei TaxID=669202 RepID=A0A0C2IFA3_THEKT|nr:Protein SGT1 ecdysoneless [Thelohanellus kitauei]
MEDPSLYFDIYHKYNNEKDTKLWLKNQIQALIQKFEESDLDHIWDKNGFQFKIKSENSHYYIQASHTLGSGFDDEIYDSDGDFLLIDSHRDIKVPDHKPEEFSVFSYKGGLYPIHKNTPIPSIFHMTPEDLSNNKLIDQVEYHINSRITLLQDNMIEFNVKCPHELAYMLHKCPKLITNIVNEYRDNFPVNYELLKAIESYAEPLVRYRVKFSKNLFANIYSDGYQPSRRSSWSTYGSDLPLVIGYRLTAGYHAYKQLITRSDDDFIFKTAKWKKFMEGLKSRKYFKNEIEGSAEYQRLEEEARQHFKQKVVFVEHSDTVVYDPTSCVPELLANYSSDLPIPPCPDVSDDLSWLNDSKKTEEELIYEKYNKFPDFKESRLNNFSSARSDVLEGVEFNEPNLEKNIEIEPEGVEKALKKLLDDFDINYCSDDSLGSLGEEEAAEMSRLMDEIGNDLKGCDDAPVGNEILNLMNSIMSQTEAGGPASNLMNVLGLNQEAEKSSQGC